MFGWFFLLNVQVTYPIPRQQASWSLEDLPRTVALTMHQGSTVTSMDFHPSHPSVLLGMIRNTFPYKEHWHTLCISVILWLGSALQLGVLMVKLHCGNLDHGINWFQSHSKFGIWPPVHRYFGFRFKCCWWIPGIHALFTIALTIFLASITTGWLYILTICLWISKSTQVNICKYGL